MTLKDQLNKDIKTAMLAGEKLRASTLQLVKSAALYKEVALGNRDIGLDDAQMIEIFSKEAKKRIEAAELYEKNGDTARAQAERDEYEIIAHYLPKQLSDEDLKTIVDAAITEFPDASMQQMGAIIGAVKAKVGAGADGGRIASLVKRALL